MLAQRLAEAGIANDNVRDKPYYDSEQANDGWHKWQRIWRDLA
jgi:hypothetical protein